MKNTLFCLLFFSGIIVNAQQLPEINLAVYNHYLVNPAAAGSEEYGYANLIHRKQWMDIQGAPQVSMICIDGPVRSKKIGLGLCIYNEKESILSHSGGYGTYSYRFAINQSHSIGVGVSGGILNNSIDFNDIQATDADDPVLFANEVSSVNFDANMGLIYTWKDLSAGLAGFYLLNSKLKYQNVYDTKIMRYQYIRHYSGSLSYKFKIRKGSYYIQPYAFIRTAQGLPVQAEGNLLFNWKDMLWAGAGYRQNNSLVFSVAALLYDNIFIASSYEYYLSDLKAYGGTTFELSVGYRFHKSGNASDKSYDKRDLKNIEQTLQTYSEEIDRLKYENKELNTQLENSNKNMLEMKEEVERLKKNSGLSDEDKELIRQLKEKNQMSPEEMEKLLKEHQMSEEDETNFEANKKFTSYDYCVIVGAYKDIDNAKLGQQILRREFGLETTIIGQDNGKYLFLCSDFFTSPSEVKKEYERLKSLDIERYIIGEPWIYHAK